LSNITFAIGCVVTNQLCSFVVILNYVLSDKQHDVRFVSPTGTNPVYVSIHQSSPEIVMHENIRRPFVFQKRVK